LEELAHQISSTFRFGFWLFLAFGGGAKGRSEERSTCGEGGPLGRKSELSNHGQESNRLKK